MKTLLQNLQIKLYRRSKFFALKTERTLKNKKKLLAIALFFLLVGGMGYYTANNLVIGLGESLDNKLFLKTNGEIQVGDYVVIKILGDPIVGKNLLTKKVFCKGGQTLKIVVDEYFCEDTFIGKAVKETKDGIPIEPYNPCIRQENRHFPFEFYTKDVFGRITKVCEYQIPDGYYFVAGTHPRSYDSRYFGLVSKEEIISKVVPIL